MSGSARALHILLLGIWLGATLFFLVLAPQITPILESGHLAGEVITRALGIIDGFGALAGPLILVTLFVGWLPLAAPLRGRTLGALVMTVSVMLSRYWTTPELLRAKAEMSFRLEHMDPAHPLMEQYQSFHTISSGLMLLHLIACAFMLVAALRSSRPRRSFGGIEL